MKISTTVVAVVALVAAAMMIAKKVILKNQNNPCPQEKGQWVQERHLRANPDASQRLPVLEIASGCHGIKVFRRVSSATFAITHATLLRGLPSQVDANSTRIAVTALRKRITLQTRMPISVFPRDQTCV
jgi:hypothetical protein